MGRPANTPEVLWSKVDRRGPEECWPWLGFKNAEGYGRTWIKDRGYYAHRVIFDLANPGLISLTAPKNGSGESGLVLHHCDNPQCCNPAHLFIGTHEDNMADKKRKGRAFLWSSSLDTPRAKLSRDNVLSIRERKARGVRSVDLARDYSVSVCTIKSVISGRYYSDVTP